MRAIEDSRPLTEGERRLAASIFGDSIDREPVRIVARKWWPLQPRNVLMAPMGHIHVHPESALRRDDYSVAGLPMAALFLHELTHVWQSQRCGKWYLPLMRHPFCRYAYTYAPGRPFVRYGIEQQAEIVRHVFLLRQGFTPDGAPPLSVLEALISPLF